MLLLIVSLYDCVYSLNRLPELWLCWIHVVFWVTGIKIVL